ncbi:DUF354 domain-containing protein [Lentimicrobium sp.]
MFKYVINNLKNSGHIIKVTINTKDILEELLIADGIDHENILPVRRKINTKISAFFTLMKKTIALYKVQKRDKYDILVGTESALSHVGWIFRKPVIIMDEDDLHIIPEVGLVSFPFANYIVSPDSCDLGKWSKKKISYPGYQKLAYLHPNFFKPDKAPIKDIVDNEERFFLIRVSELSAYHDTSTQGFSVEFLIDLVEKLKPFGKVIISTEKKLPESLAKYCHLLDITKIHHFLYYADILIADSQSMCVEAAVLGTPSLRYSNFAGKIGVLEELEHKFELTFGYSVNHKSELLNKLNELLNINDIKEVWQQKRFKLLEEKIDVTAFWSWLLDKFPYSVHIWKEQKIKF